MRHFGGRAPASFLYQNRIKILSETAIAVICRAKSRFPKPMKRLKNSETEWKPWKGRRRAQGRCATRLRYAPTFAGPFILDHRSRHPFRKPFSASKVAEPYQNPATVTCLEKFRHSSLRIQRFGKFIGRSVTQTAVCAVPVFRQPLIIEGVERVDQS
jgi:hypothetical protein